MTSIFSTAHIHGSSSIHLHLDLISYNSFDTEFGRNLLPARANHLSLNHSPFGTRRNDGVTCDLTKRLYGSCPSLSFLLVISYSNYYYYPLNNVSPKYSHNILNSLCHSRNFNSFQMYKSCRVIKFISCLILFIAFFFLCFT